MTRAPNRMETIIAVFTAAYVLAFSVWFLSIGNLEFIVYVATMLILMALVGFSLGKAEYPPAILWALSIWGLLHMAGGGVPVNGSVLYNLVLLDLFAVGENPILKYDQAVHAYGFGVAAWLLHHLLTRHFPAMRGTASAVVFPALASMGLGALNEMIEFTAVVMVPDTNVGGYINTALDLVFNAIGAWVGALLAARRVL
ncbi:DUF2238 domain-containing protein [Cognatishimia sp. F0-27]|uniref:DUF2238 domain-containing protein n=1 Tax=Cognatishimia sp. F0-27 TaxID=2816855 RepID=UPI001D0CD012|nr:DUF2238 domain-containing protein [Cognatishimia sp. F0-27]MCC1491405.1 DUF2238 domain-containing protein [Cognatishimia sp. F0-27]